NRWLGTDLRDNGSTAPPYHAWVTEFQTQYGVASRNGSVDECTQDAMIMANHQSDVYVSWVQQSLNQAGVSPAVASDGAMNPETTKAIKKFQRTKDLKDNGWVGAKTESALRKSGARKPPDHRPIRKVLPLIQKPITRSGWEMSRRWLANWHAGLVGDPAKQE